MTYLHKIILILLLAGPLTQTVVHDSDMVFTTIDVPGAGTTAVFATNSAGDMVGLYGPDNDSAYHGFLLRSGVFTSFDYPGAGSTWATSMNDSGLIAGSATRASREVDFFTTAPLSSPSKMETPVRRSSKYE